jgi:hypothetical protein
MPVREREHSPFFLLYEWSFVDRYKLSRGREGKTTRRCQLRRENTILSFYYTIWNSQVQAAEVSQRRTAVSSKCFQLYYTCSDCWPSHSPLLFPSFFLLLLWRFLTSQLFCVHYTYVCFDIRLSHRLRTYGLLESALRKSLGWLSASKLAAEISGLNTAWFILWGVMEIMACRS